MKKKHPPEQYAAKPKPVVAKPLPAPPEHPAVGVSKKLVSWLDRGGVPPSVILLHGLHFARNPENDGLPVDTLRPLLKMQGTDGKAISEMLDILARPQTNKIREIATWLQSCWVKKSAATSRVALPQKKRQPPASGNKPAKQPRKSTEKSSTKPVIVVKKEALGREGKGLRIPLKIQVSKPEKG